MPAGQHRDVDDFPTPPRAWGELFDAIGEHIVGKTIWEPFVSDSDAGEASAAALRAHLAGGELVQTTTNFFVTQPPTDFFGIISNPPFSDKFRIIERCLLLQKPAILLLPSQTLDAQAFQRLAETYRFKLGLVIPFHRLYFIEGMHCPFSTYWFCINWPGVEGFLFGKRSLTARQQASANRGARRRYMYQRGGPAPSSPGNYLDTDAGAPTEPANGQQIPPRQRRAAAIASTAASAAYAVAMDDSDDDQYRDEYE